MWTIIDTIEKVDNVIEASQEFINLLPDYDLWIDSSVESTKKLADKNDIYNFQYLYRLELLILCFKSSSSNRF